MVIPLGKRIVIPGNRRWRNGMTIPILLFGNNSHISIRIQTKLLKKTLHYFKNKNKKTKNKKKKK
jgi:hypothetical protein